jgi:hypothetical protein
VTLPERILALHRALDEADVPHAFGGALALAWCTRRARGTIDVDLNVFLPPGQATVALRALPDGVAWDEEDVAAIARDGQVRLWWDGTPVDLFFDTTPFHLGLAGRAVREPFLGEDVPFLGCDDLAVFKAYHDRSRDWADLEEMAAAGALDRARVLGVLVDHLGPDDPRVARLHGLS